MSSEPLGRQRETEIQELRMELSLIMSLWLSVKSIRAPSVS